MYAQDIDEIQNVKSQSSIKFEMFHTKIASMAEWLRAEWLRAWGTLAMMKLWRREVVSSIPDRGTIVG